MNDIINMSVFMIAYICVKIFFKRRYNMNKCVFLVCSEIDSSQIVNMMNKNQLDFNHKIMGKANGMNNMLIALNAPDYGNPYIQQAQTISLMEDIKKVIRQYTSSKYYIIPDKLINKKTKEEFLNECLHQ